MYYADTVFVLIRKSIFKPDKKISKPFFFYSVRDGMSVSSTLSLCKVTYNCNWINWNEKYVVNKNKEDMQYSENRDPHSSITAIL